MEFLVNYTNLHGLPRWVEKIFSIAEKWVEHKKWNQLAIVAICDHKFDILQFLVAYPLFQWKVRDIQKRV